MRTFSMHGGAGALLSVGLLRAVPYERFARCVEGARLEGGDSFISLCLWEVRSFQGALTPCRWTWRPPTVFVCTQGARCASIVVICAFSMVKHPSTRLEACLKGAQRYDSNWEASSIKAGALPQAGYGMVNPDPLWHPQGLTMFDTCPRGLHADTDILPKAAHTLGNLLSAAAGTCGGLCQVRLPMQSAAIPHAQQICWEDCCPSMLSVSSPDNALKEVMCSIRCPVKAPA